MHPVVHLELRSPDPARACAIYAALFGWGTETVEAGKGGYVALALAHAIGGGAVEAPGAAAAWMPYVEVGDVAERTERARRLGAAVLLEPREGPAGSRSVLAVPAGAQVALWQPKGIPGSPG
jgi:predicted enzyme related to lactoylglutathione lyase